MAAYQDNFDKVFKKEFAPIAKEQKEAAADLKEASVKLASQGALFKETSSELKGFVRGWGNTLKSMLGPFGKVGHALGKDLKKFFTKDEKSGAAAKEAANEARRTAVKHETMMGAIAANTKRTADGIKGILKGLAKKALDFGIGALGLSLAVIAAPIVAIVAFFKQLKAELAFLKALTGRGFQRMLQPFKSFMNVIRRMGAALRELSQSGRRGSGLARSIVRMGEALQRAGRSVVGFFRTLFRPITNLVRWFGRRGKAMVMVMQRVTGLISRGIRTVMGFVRTLATPFTALFRIVRAHSPLMRNILRWAGNFGRLLGRFFLPITIIMSVFDFVRGFMRGYSSDGLIGGIREGVAEVFGTLIGWPLNMLKKGVAWILAAFGFKDIAAKLNELDFKALVMDLVRIPFNAMQAIWRWIKLLFTDPGAAFAKLWEGMKGLAQMAKDALSAIWTKITTLFAPIGELALAGWTNLKTFVVDKATAIKDWVVKLFSFGKDTVLAGWTGLLAFVTTAWTNLTAFFTKWFSFGADTVLAGWNGLLSFITTAWNNITAFFTKWFSFGVDTVIEGWDGLLSFITGIIGTLKTWFTDKFSFAADTVIAGWDGLLSLITTAVGGIKDFFWKGDGTGLLEFSLPDLSLNLPTMDELLGMLPEWMTSPIQWLKSKIPFFGSKKEPETAPPPDAEQEEKGRLDMAKTFHDMIGNMSWGVGKLFKKFFDVEDMLGVMKLVGFRAGGYLKANQLAMVGEEGPELFMTGTGGTVIPNHALGPVESGGQQPIVVNQTTAAPVTTNTSTAVKVATAIGITDPFTHVQVAY